MTSKNKYEIVYLNTAEKDLYEIFDYIKIDNPSAAINLLNKINHSISLLANNPDLGIIPRNQRLMRKGYRMLVIEKYLVFYVKKENLIQIRRRIHGSRKYSLL